MLEEPIEDLLRDKNEEVVKLGNYIQRIKDAFEAKKITEDEFNDLMKTAEKMYQLLEDGISLNTKITINHCLAKLYEAALIAKSLAP